MINNKMIKNKYSVVLYLLSSLLLSNGAVAEQSFEYKFVKIEENRVGFSTSSWLKDSKDIDYNDKEELDEEIDKIIAKENVVYHRLLYLSAKETLAQNKKYFILTHYQPTKVVNIDVGDTFSGYMEITMTNDVIQGQKTADASQILSQTAPLLNERK